METFSIFIIFIAAILQTVMIVKFFNMANDVSEIKHYIKKMTETTSQSENAETLQNPEEFKQPEFTWKSYVALIFLLAAIAFLLYLYY